MTWSHRPLYILVAEEDIFPFTSPAMDDPQTALDLVLGTCIINQHETPEAIICFPTRMPYMYVSLSFIGGVAFVHAE